MSLIAFGLIALCIAYYVRREPRPLAIVKRLAASAMIAMGLWRGIEGSLLAGAVIAGLGLYGLWRVDGGRWRVSDSVARARALLDVGPHATAREIRAAHRRRAAVAHPDLGGSHIEMQALNVARDLLLRRARGPATRG